MRIDPIHQSYLRTSEWSFSGFYDAVVELNCQSMSFIYSEIERRLRIGSTEKKSLGVGIVVRSSYNLHINYVLCFTIALLLYYTTL